MKRLLAHVSALIATVFVLTPILLQAGPVGEKIVVGNVTLDRSTAGLLTVQQASDRAIINWQDFSIGANEITRFMQPGASSALLNRVVGANPSSILGKLEANGQIFLINPAGILVGPGGVIDTKGFVASTLNLSDESFLNSSKLTLGGDSRAAIQNLGKISASEGNVYLIARTVENAGSISAPGGTVGLAGGTEVILAEDGADKIAVLVGDGGSVSNSGSIDAASAELKAAGGNMYALAINNTGLVRANTLVNEGGKIVLKASSGTALSSGTLDASGTVGGEVQVLGELVGLTDNAVVNASGDTGGGTVLIGGDFQGKNESVQNAFRTYAGPNTTIHADAISSGDGGKVIVWANDIARFYGNLTARGGANSGNGGNVEISGKETLVYDGLVNVGAAAGQGGNILFDPRDVTIATGGSTDIAGNDIFAENTGVDVTLSPTAIAALITGNLELQAQSDFIINNNITAVGAGNFTLRAGGSITLAAGVVIDVNGNFAAYLNDSTGTATPGDPSVFSMGDAASTIRTSSAGGNILIDMATGNTGGSITLGSLEAIGGDIRVVNNFAGSSILSVAGTPIVRADSVSLETTSGAGTIGASGTPIRVRVTNLDAATAAGNIFLNSPTIAQSLNIGSAGLGAVTGITSGGTLELTGAGPITQSEVITTAGAATLATGSAYDINLGSANAIGGAVLVTAAKDFTLNNGTATVDFATGSTVISGNLTVTTSHASGITDTGTLSVAGSASFTATGANPINLGSVNNFVGPVSFVGGAVALNDSDSIQLAGTASTATTLAVTSGASITQNGSTITASGLATFTPAAAGNVVLNNTGNNFASVSVPRGAVVTVYDTDAIALDDIGNTAALTGLLTVQAGDNITQTGGKFIIQSGSAAGANFITTATGKTVILGEASNNFGTGTISATTTVGTLSDVTITSLGAVKIGALTTGGNLSVTAAGAITQNGALSVTGTSALVSGNNPVTLSNPANNFVGIVTLTGSTGAGATITISDANSLSMASAAALLFGDITLGAGGNLTIDASGGTGAISGTGIVTVPGTTALTSSAAANISLNNAASDFVGTVTVNVAADLSLTDKNTLTIVVGAADDLTLGSITATDLSITANSGNTITDVGALTVTGTTTLSSGGGAGAITLDNVANNFGTVQVTSGAGAVTIVDAGAIDLGASTVGGAFNVTATAAGDITDSGALAVTGVSTFTAAGGQSILLDETGNVFTGAITFASGGVLKDVTVTSGAALALGALTITGDLTAATAGAGFDITQGGALIIPGTATFTTAGNGAITLGSANNFGKLAINAPGNGAVAVTDSNAVILSASTVGGTFAVTAGGDITNDGTLAVTGAATFTGANTTSITLDSASNNFGAAVNIATSGGTLANVTITDTTALALDAITVSANLTVTAGGAITQTATVLTVPGTATFTTSGNVAITLGQANDFGTLAITSPGNAAVAVTDANNVILGDTTVGGAYAITATAGDITDSGTLTITGASTFTAVGTTGSVTLDSALNNFTGDVTFAGVGTDLLNVSITDNSALNLTALTLVATGNLTVNSKGAADLTDQGALVVPGTTTITVASGRNVTLDNSNDFGVIVVNQAQNITLNDVNGIDLGTMAPTGTLSVTGSGTALTPGAIIQSGTLTVTGGTATFANGVSGDITLTAANNFGTVVITSAQNVTLSDQNAIILGASTIAGNLSLTASAGTAGTITQSGAVAVNGTTTLVNTGQDITLDNVSNNFLGAVTITSAKDVALKDANAIVLGAMTVTGNLGVTALAGTITQSGALAVTGTATMSATGQNITLNNTGNNFATLAISAGNDILIVDANALVLGTSTVLGNLGVTTSGAITESGVVSVNAAGKVATFAAGGNAITLNTENNLFKTVVFTGATDTVTVKDADSIDLGTSSAAALTVTSLNGDITQSGPLTVTGNANFITTAGTGNITVNNAGNAFGSVGFTTGSVATSKNVNVRELGAFGFLGSTVEGTLTVKAGGAVTQTSGTLVIGGVASFDLGASTALTLADPLNDFATVTITSAGAVTIADQNAIILGSGSLISGNLSVDANPDNVGTETITQSGAITVLGTTTLKNAAGANITLTSANDFVGAVTVVRGLDVSLTDANSINLGAATVSGNFSVTAAGTITDSGTLLVNGAAKTATFAAGSANNITLDDAANDFTKVVITSGNNVSLIDANALNIGAGTVSGNLSITTQTGAGLLDFAGALTVAGNLTLTPTGAVSEGAGTVAVTGTTTITAAGLNVVLGGANNFVGPVSVTGVDVTLTDANAIELGASTVTGNLSLTAGGAVTDSGTLAITGTSTISASGQPVTLDSPANNFVGAVGVTGAAVTLVDVGAIDLGASTVSGTYTVTAGDNITSSGALAITGVSTFTAPGGKSISVDTAGTVFTGTVAFNAVSGTLVNVSILDGSALLVPALTVSGNLTVATTGAGFNIGQSGALVVPGTASFTTVGATTITLNDAANNFGTVSVTSPGGSAVAFTDSNAVILGATSIGGALTVTSGGDITESGVVSVTGATTLTSGTGGSINLGTQANHFAGAITVSAATGNVLNLGLRADDNIAISGPLTLGGTLTVITTDGTAKNITQSGGALTVTGTTTLTAGTGSVTLATAGNDFIGAVAVVSANNVTLLDAGAIDLGAMTVAGNLTLTAGGAVSNSGTLAITGTTGVTATGFNVSLNSGANNFVGAVSVAGADVILVDAGAIDLGASTITGTLSVTGAGAITDSGNLVVNGTAKTTTLVAGAGNDIVLNSAGNDFTTVVITSGRDVTLVDANLLDLGASTVSGTLTVTSGGALSDSGVVAVTGATTISASGLDVVLDQANNFVGAVSVTAANVTLTDANAIILGDSTVSGTLTVNASGAVTDSGTLAITGVTTVNAAGQNVTLNSAANNFVGAVSVNGLNVALVDVGAINLGASTVTGTYAVTAGDDITSSGTLTITGASTFIAPRTKSITVHDAGNVFTGTVSFAAVFDSLQNVTIVDTTALDLQALSILGNLTVTAGGALTDSGNLVIPGSTSITATGQNVTLDSAANNFGGAVTVAGANVTLVDVNAIDFGASTITGNLILTAGGAVSDSGTLLITGTTAITATTFNVVLDQVANDFGGAVSANGLGVTLVDVNAINLGASTITGALTVTAGGAVSNTGTLAVTGATSVTATGFNVSLNSALNNFVGAVSVAGADVTIVDANAIDLGTSAVTGNLSVTAAGLISDSGNVVVNTAAKTATFVAGAANNIVLDRAANDFTKVIITSGNDVTIVDANALELGASSVSGNLTLTAAAVDFAAGASTVGGNLALTATGAVTDTGTITVTGTTLVSAATLAVTLDSANNFVGAVSVLGSNVALVDAGAIVLGASTVTGTYAVTAGDSITSTGALDITGAATFTAPTTKSISLNNAANTFLSTVTFASGGTLANVTIVDDTALDLSALTISGNLAVTAGGALSDSGTLVVPGTTTISAAGQAVVLDQAANNFGGAVSVTGANVTLVDVNAIDLGASTVTGTLTLTAGGAVSDSGTIAVTGVTTVSAAGQNVILDQAANNFVAAVSVTGANVTLVDANAIVLGASTVTGNLAVTAGGAVSNTGTLAVTGTTTVTATGNAVALNSAANNFGGAVSVAGLGVTLVDVNAIDLGASTITGALTVTAGGAVSDSGTLAVTGVTTISASGQNVVLDQAANNFVGAVSVTGADVTLVDANAIDIGASTISGNLTVTAAGVISDSGALVANGVAKTATFAAGAGNNIVLDNAANNFTTVLITTGLDVTLVDVNAINLGASAVSGNLVLTAGGAVTQTGVITANGASKSATITATGFDVTLSLANDFTTVGVTGANVTLTDANALALAASTVSGNLIVTAAGAVSNSGTLAITGTTSVSNAGNNVALNSAANNFTGAVSVTGVDVTLVDVNAINLGTITATGDLTVTAGGAITDSGTLLVTTALKTATFTNTAGAITLDDLLSDFTILKVTSAGNVAVTDDNSVVLGTSTVGGTLTITADNAGSITQATSATLKPTGAATFNVAAGANVVLGNAGNVFGSTVSFASVAHGTITVRDSNDISLGLLSATTLTVTADQGAITQGAAWTATTATITTPGVHTGGVSINLGSANDFGTLTLSQTSVAGGSVTVVEANSVILGAATIKGALSITAGNSITQSGALTTSSTSSFTATAGSIDLSNAANNFATGVTIGGTLVNLSITDTTPIKIADGTSASGILVVKAPLIEIGDDAGGADTITGTTSQTYDGPVILNEVSGTTFVSSGTVWFKDTVDSATANNTTLLGEQGITVNTTGLTQFDKALGSQKSLTTLTTDAGGTVSLGVTTVAQTITAATISFGEDVTIIGNPTFYGSTSVAFGGKIEGSASVETVAINSPLTSFGGTVGATTPLASVTTDSDGTTTLNTPTLKALVVDLKDTVALTAATTIGGATTTSVTLGGVTLSQNLTLQASGTAGAVTVNGNIKDTDHTHALTVTALGTATLVGNIGSGVANEQPNTVSLTGASIVLKGTEITTAGDQTYTGPVTIGATTTLTGANVQFTSTVDADSAASARALTLATSATTKLDGVVGGTAKFGTLTISGAGTTTLGTGAALGITATTQSYGQTIALASDTTFTGSNIAFSGAAVDGAKAVVITAGDVTTINSVIGGVTPITTLATDSAGSTVVKQNVTTSSTQVYADTVQVAADVTLTGSAITFSKTLDSDSAGTRNLTLNASGADVTLTGVVGGTASFAALTTDVGGNTLINGGAVTATTQTYGDTVKILKATTLTGTTVTLAAVDKGGSTDQNLTVTASGVTTFGGVVAGVKDLVVDGGGSAAINAATVTTSGNQTITDALTIGVNSTLTGKDISLGQVDGVGAGTEDLTLVATGTIYESANVGSGNKFNVLTFNGKLVISANETMDANTLVFLKEVDADTADLRTLTANATTTTFTKAVGGSKRLLSLTTDATGSTTLTGNVTAKTQNYQDDVTIAGNITLTAPTVSAVVGTVTFGKTLEPSTGTVALTLKAAGDTTFNGTVGAGTSFLSLTTDGTKSGAVYTDKVQINGGSIGATTLKIGENVVISTDTTLTGTTISVAGTLDGTGASTESLTINSTGVTTLSGAVGGGTALLSLTTDGVGANESTVLQGNVTATTQTYGDDVTIGANLTLTGTEVTFNKIVKGAAANKQDLTINTASGAIVFGGKVGSTAFNLLSTLGSGTVSISGGTVSAVSQSFDSIVKILADTTFTGTTVEFKNTLNETGSGGLYAVTVNATTTKFDSEIGTTAKLLSLKTDSKGTTTIFADIQAATIDFTDDVILDIPGAGTAGTLTLQGTDVSFAKTISSQASGENPNLLVNAGGTTTFKGNVGANSLKPLNITTDAAGTTVLQGTVIITGKNLTFNDPVVLQGAATLYPEVALALKNTANGAQTLTVGSGSGGSIEIESAIGGTTTLTKFVSQGNVTAHPEYGTIHLRNGAITATTQEYNNSVSLEANATLTGGAVTIVGTVLGDGVANQRQLNIVASGVTTLKNIGNNGAGDLGLVQTDSKGSTVLTGVIYGTTLQFQDPAVIDGTAVALNATTVAFDKTIEGKDKAAAQTLGNATFDFLSNQGVKTIAIGQQVGTVAANFGSGTAGKIYKAKVAGSLTLNTETYADTARWQLVGDQSTTLWNFLSGFETQTVSAGQKVGLASAYGSGGVATTVYSYVPAGPTAVALNTQDYADTTVWKQVFSNGDNRLTVNVSGTATFSGAIGKTKSLSELTFGGAGTTVIAGDVSSFYLTAGRPITLLANSTVTAPVRADFSSTIDGDVADTRSLTVNGGRVIFTGAVGGTRALSSIKTDATGTPYDTTTFTSGVIAADTIALKDTLKQAVNTTVTGKTVTFATVNAGANTLALNGTAITVEGVTSGALTVNGPITLKGNVTTAGANQTYNDTVNVDGTLTLNGATLAFAKSVDAKATSAQLTLTASAANTIGAGLGASREFNTLTITTGAVALTGDVKAKTLVITPAVTLQSDSVVTASTSATFTAALVGNSKSLTVNGGDVVFTANPTGLVDLKTDAAGTAKGSTEFATGTTVTGDLIIKDKLVLLANTALTGSNVTLGEVVSGKTGALGTYSLSVNVANATGLATFNGNIGVAAGNEALLTTFTVADAGAQTGSFELGKGTISVNTSAGQTYSIGGTVVGTVTLTGTTVGFSKAVNAKTANAGTFLVNNTGVLTIAEGLGATKVLSSFTTGTGGSTTLTGNLGAKTVDIKNALTLGGAVVVDATTSAGFVAITGAGNSLTVNGGDTVFAAVPSGLANLSTDSGTGVAVKGSTKFTSATPSLSTTGAITINDKLILADTTTLTATTGVTLGEVVSLTTSQALTVNSGNGGTITLNGNIGKVKTGASEVNLLSLTVGSADTLGSIVLGKTSNGTLTIDTTSAQTYADITTLQGTVTLTAVDGTTAANGDVTFSKAIQAPDGLKANAGKLVINTSDVGTVKSIGAANGFNPGTGNLTIGLAEFTTGTTGTSSLGGDIVATKITYGNVVTLTASSVMTASTSATFAGVTGGGNSLTVNGGSTTFNANPTGLVDLKTDAAGNVAGTTTFKDGTAVAVTVTGDLVINDTLALSADSTFTAANIGLDKVNGAFALTLTASAKTTLADNIGSSGKLTTLTVNTVNLDLGVNAVTSTMTITTSGAQTWNETGTSVLLQNVKLTADTTPSITIDTDNGHTLTLAP